MKYIFSSIIFLLLLSSNSFGSILNAKINVVATFANTTACTGSASVSFTSTFVTNDGCTPISNYCKTCLPQTCTFKLLRQYPYNDSAFVTVATQNVTLTAGTSTINGSFGGAITQPGYYTVQVDITSSNGGIVGGGSSSYCVINTGNPGYGSSNWQYYSINQIAPLSTLIAPTIDGITLSTVSTVFTPVNLTNCILNTIGGFTNGFGPDGNFGNNPTGQFRVTVKNLTTSTSPLILPWQNPLNSGYNYNLGNAIRSYFGSSVIGNMQVTIEVKNDCASATFNYYINSNLVVNGSTINSTSSLDVCGDVRLSGSAEPNSSGTQFKYTITECSSTGVATGTPFIYGPTTTPVFSLSGIAGSPLAVIANANKYYIIKVETSPAGTFAPNLSLTGRIRLLGILSGNYNVGYFSATSGLFVSQGAAGNNICSPIIACQTELRIGQASGTSSGSLTGLRFKLEKLTSACNAPVQSFTTIFDGTAIPAGRTLPYPIYNFGGTTWSQLAASVAAYCNSTDIAEAAVAPARANPKTLKNAFFNGYQNATLNDVFKLTAYIYNTACGTASITQVAYIQYVDGSCKTDGSETTTRIDNNGNINTEISIYPNPSSAQVNISIPESLKDAKLSLYDIQGREVAVDFEKIGINSSRIDVSNLSKGIYLLGMNGNKIAKRIVIQ